MKALLDEELSPQIAALLRKAGLDMEAVADRPDLVGRSDMVIFEVACTEDRAVITNKDVWEVIAVVRDNDGDAAEAARYLEIPLGLVQAAIAYYGAYTSEIDQQIELNEQEATEAYAAFLAGQAAVQR